MNNKIINRWLTTLILAGVLLTESSSFAQAQVISRYGLSYVNSRSAFIKTLAKQSGKEMVSLNQISGLIFDLRYATTNNFLHRKLYEGDIKTSFLRAPAFRALDSVSRDCKKLGYLLVIFDAYRPYSVTELLWEAVKDDRYAADPSKGSGHNRGVAVDLTLAEQKTGRLVKMPTGFDNFTDSAFQQFAGADAEATANRELLKSLMIKRGFIPLATEWWHYSWPNPEKYEVLDLSIVQLESLNLTR